MNVIERADIEEIELMRGFVGYFVAVVFSLLSCSSLSAQGKKIEFSAAGGFTSLFIPERMQDSHKLGFNIRGGVSYMLSPRIGISFNTAYNAFKRDESFRDIIAGGRFSVIELLAEGRFYSSPNDDSRRLNFYGLAGGGLSIAKLEDAVVAPEGAPSSQRPGDSDTEFMVSIGMGSSFKATSMFSVFMEVRLCILRTEANSLELLEAEDIVYLPLSVGVIF